MPCPAAAPAPGRSPSARIRCARARPKQTCPPYRDRKRFAADPRDRASPRKSRRHDRGGDGPSRQPSRPYRSATRRPGRSNDAQANQPKRARDARLQVSPRKSSAGAQLAAPFDLDRLFPRRPPRGDLFAAFGFGASTAEDFPRIYRPISLCGRLLRRGRLGLDFTGLAHSALLVLARCVPLGILRCVTSGRSARLR